MYSKLFARISESSLMEESILVRYVFMMLLAICDATGHVIGTDIAIARRINIALDEFTQARTRLMAPDPNSNSTELEGRRIVASEGERGYRVVNYLTYRNIRDEAHRREYMRDYMNKYRAQGRDNSRVNSVNTGKRQLANTESDSKAKAEAKVEREQATKRLIDSALKLDARSITNPTLEQFTEHFASHVADKLFSKESVASCYEHFQKIGWDRRKHWINEANIWFLYNDPIQKAKHTKS